MFVLEHFELQHSFFLQQLLVCNVQLRRSLFLNLILAQFVVELPSLDLILTDHLLLLSQFLFVTLFNLLYLDFQIYHLLLELEVVVISFILLPLQFYFVFQLIVLLLQLVVGDLELLDFDYIILLRALLGLKHQNGLLLIPTLYLLRQVFNFEVLGNQQFLIILFLFL